MSISPTLQPDCDPFRTEWGRPASSNNHPSISSGVFDLGPSDGYWASPPPSDATDQLPRTYLSDGDSVCAPTISAAACGGPPPGDSGIHPSIVEGPQKKRQGGDRRSATFKSQKKRKHYCGKCNSDGVSHTYDTCPTWPRCRLCKRKGHWDNDCRRPHQQCTVNRCKVHQSHAFYGTRCPLWGGHVEDGWHYNFAEEMDAGEALFDDIDWEAQDHSS
jgi:hypothetical protein